MLFPSIYALYCSELPEREKGLRDHLWSKGLRKVGYWRGYHGNTWGIRPTRPYAPGEYISPGHVGLDMGYWALLQHIFLSMDGLPNDEAVITLEDDVVIPDNFHEKVNDILGDLELDFPEWDLVLLGLAECEPHVWHKVTGRIGKPDSRLCEMKEPFGTHAIMMRKRALPVLLDNLRKAERNLDQQLWEFVLRPGLLKWCAVLPTLVKQRTFDYTGSGKVEWGPSCIDPLHEDRRDEAPALAVREQDLKRTAGFLSPERPSSELIAMTNLVVDPYPCIYRGEPLEEFGRSGRKSVPVVQCARLNKPCHSKSGLGKTVFVKSRRDPVESCEDCKIRIEMSPDRTRPRLPLPEGHFNPSMAMYDGRLIFASRDSWGHSKVALWEMTNEKRDWTGEWKAKALASLASDHKEAPRLEDPRLFTVPNPETGETELRCMFNLPDAYPPKLVQVGYVRFNRGLSQITDTVVFRSPANNLYEKNWVPFYDGKELRWIYHTKPDHVVMGESTNYTTPNNLPWTGGVIRGGACPVKWGWNPKNGYSVYYHFFHGCLKRMQGSVYTIGCVVLEADPPFRVIRQTPIPLMWPDLPAASEDVTKRYVLWPGGAVPHEGAWHLAVGIDDTFCRIVRIPFDVVERALSDVPETVKVTTIRNTPIAMGSKEPT